MESKGCMKFALLMLLASCLLASPVVGRIQLRGSSAGVADTVKQARKHTLLTEEGLSSTNVEGVTDYQKSHSPTNGALISGTEEVITSVPFGAVKNNDGTALGGVEITLLDANGIVADTTMTDTNGNNFVDCNKGVISGNVADDDGMPVQGVTIKLLDANDVAIATTLTNTNGDFRFKDLPPGNYTVEETNPSDYPTIMSD